MTVLCLSVGSPRDVVAGEVVVRTGIFKTPVTGRRWVSSSGIEGDGQADLTVHGGMDKAVYVYPSEHYPVWRKELGDAELSWGSFGENLTTVGLLESQVSIGDRFQMGSCEFVVTQPRVPCYKLAIRLNRADILTRFTSVSRSGFYLSVEQEGEIGAGDEIRRIAVDPRGLTVTQAYRLKLDGGSRRQYEAAASHPSLSAAWRDSFRRQV